MSFMSWFLGLIWSYGPDVPHPCCKRDDILKFDTKYIYLKESRLLSQMKCGVLVLYVL